jgi:hypothetical protein
MPVLAGPLQTQQIVHQLINLNKQFTHPEQLDRRKLRQDEPIDSAKKKLNKIVIYPSREDSHEEEDEKSRHRASEGFASENTHPGPPAVPKSSQGHLQGRG